MTRDTILDTSRSSLYRPLEELEVEEEEEENPTLFCPLSSNLLLVEVSPSPSPRLPLSNTPVWED